MEIIMTTTLEDLGFCYSDASYQVVLLSDEQTEFDETGKPIDGFALYLKTTFCSKNYNADININQIMDADDLIKLGNKLVEMGHKLNNYKWPKQAKVKRAKK